MNTKQKKKQGQKIGRPQKFCNVHRWRQEEVFVVRSIDDRIGQGWYLQCGAERCRFFLKIFIWNVCVETDSKLEKFENKKFQNQKTWKLKMNTKKRTKLIQTIQKIYLKIQKKNSPNSKNPNRFSQCTTLTIRSIGSCTRKGARTVFTQGVLRSRVGTFKRLLGLSRVWWFFEFLFFEV